MKTELTYAELATKAWKEDNYLKSFEYGLLAAQSGDINWNFCIGNMYRWGKEDIVEAQPEEAAKYYKVAADQGHPMAAVLLGEFYELGGVGRKPDYKLAAFYYKIAADDDNPPPEAPYFLAYAYETGLGVEKNYAEAFKYYKIASQYECFPQVLYKIGKFYQKGLGIPQNPEEAERYFKLAADQGYTGG